MQCRRENNNSFSPLREVYGQHKGRLLLPLDICIFVDQGGVETLQFPGAAGVFNNDDVTNTGGGVVGTVSSYDWPPANAFQVSPFTLVQPNISITNAPSGHATQTNVRAGDIVELESLDGSFRSVPTGVRGSVKQLIVSRLYPDLGHRADAYRVDFGQHLLGTSHGLRVVLDSTRDLLGMLFVTQNQNDGTCQALVYPANLI